MMKIVRLEFGSGLLPPQIAAHLKRNHEDRKVSIEQKSEKAPAETECGGSFSTSRSTGRSRSSRTEFGSGLLPPRLAKH